MIQMSSDHGALACNDFGMVCAWMCAGSDMWGRGYSESM